MSLSIGRRLRGWLAGHEFAPGYWLASALVVTVTVGWLAAASTDWRTRVQLISYPFTLDYGEGVVVSQVQRLVDGDELYPATDRSGPGFVGANYPPLFYLALRWLPDIPASIYADARWLSYASYLVAAVVAGLIVVRVTGDRLVGLATVAAVLALPPAREWGIFAKPDLLALALSLAGLAVAVTPSRYLLLAAPLCALAILTKQSMVAAPLAIALALLLSPGRRRLAVLFGALTAGLVLAPLLLLELGPADVFWHLIVSTSRGWFWERFDDIGLMFLEIYRPMALVALLGAVGLWSRHRQSPLVWYLPLAVLTLFAAGVPGSSRNYALEAGVALAIGAGVAVASLRRRRLSWARGAALVCLALLAWQAWYVWQLPTRVYGRRPPAAETTSRLRVMLNFVKNDVHGPILAENVGLLAQADVPIEYYDPSLMAKLTASQIVSDDRLLQQLKEHHFAAIMTEADLESNPERGDRWSPEVTAAIRRYYRVQFRDVLTIYVPRE